MRLSDTDIKNLKDVLTATFPTNATLGQLVATAWAISMDDITPPGPRVNMINEIIQYAVARDQVSDLIQAARTENATSRVLARVGQKLLDKIARTSRWPEPPNAYSVCFVDEECPFLDRTTLRDFCRDIGRAGVPAVCVVNGPPLTGKTYSIGLIGYLRAAGNLDLASIDFKEVPAPAQYAPEQMMQEITRQAKWAVSAPARASSGVRYCEELVNWLIGQARDSGSTLVVVLDNCHEPALNAETRELVQQMMKQISAQFSTGQAASVRLILLNCPKELEPQGAGPIHRESSRELTTADITQFITDFFNHGNNAQQAWVVEMFAKKAWDLAQKNESDAVQQNGSNNPAGQPKPPSNPAIHKAVLEVASAIAQMAG
jgi:hypothetical protein